MEQLGVGVQLAAPLRPSRQTAGTNSHKWKGREEAFKMMLFTS